MYRCKWNFIHFGTAAFIALAASAAGAAVPAACELDPYEEFGEDQQIKLTTAAWKRNDPAQCSILDAIQIFNDGKNNGFNKDPALRANACPEMTIGADDTVLIDAEARVFAPTDEVFINNDILIVRNATFQVPGKTRVFRVADAAHLVLEQVKMSGGEAIFGGVVLVENKGRLTAYQSRFEGNFAELDGGAIACQNCDVLDLRETFFTKNHADRNGGALYVTGSQFAYVEGSRIKENTAGSGAGIYTDAAADITVKASYIESNKAIGGDGGGIYSGADLFASCVKFVENEAESGNGGAFFQLAATAATTIESSAFIGNKTGMDIRGLGGAIYVAADFQLRKSSIVGSRAREGGGIYVDLTAADNSVQIENNTIAKNFASVEGGGLWITGQNAKVIPDDASHYSDTLFGGEFSFRVLHNTFLDNMSEQGQIFLEDEGVNASREILFLNNIVNGPAGGAVNCVGYVDRLLTRRYNDLSSQKTNAQWPDQSCGSEFDFKHAYASGVLQFGGVFNQGYAQTIMGDPGDLIACANVQFRDQFDRLSKCRLGAVSRGQPLALDDPKAPD